MFGLLMHAVKSLEAESIIHRVYFSTRSTRKKWKRSEIYA